MDETVRAGQSDYVLIMDDDVQFDAEGILRAATFADLARRPTIVGGHMFSLYDRSLLHAFAETIEPWAWWWGWAPNTTPRHDFGRRNLRNTPWLHRRADSDYNGWWMCLIPVRIIAEIGLALPVFIKWDDAEYGVRARDRGYPTVSLPGVASWQIPWDEKDDSRDWQAYYHLRNRLVSALLHSPHKAGGGVIGESRERQLQSLLSMYYSTAALQQLAVEDVLSGPEHLHRDLPTKIGQLRDLRAQYQDARYKADLESFPAPRRKAPDSLKHNTTPTNKINLLTKAARGTLRQFRAPRPGAAQRPQMALPYQDASWWVLAKLDSALVSSAENTNATWVIRDRGQFRRLAWRSLVLHRRLARRWSRLAAEYRAAAADFNSPERWRQTFAASVGEPAERQPTERQSPDDQ
jgi:galactofuranosylgalactofuranosylrhamnosyl-N-acetylglucosaminyl-diphospho-decaprenol beta-1,5/1,6-galactofuranosyltransferase